MTREVRVIDAFYEAQGPHSLSKALAESLYSRAIGLVAQHTGPIALAGVRGVRLRLPDDSPIKPGMVGLGSAPHTALLTRRPVIHTDGTHKRGLGRTHVAPGLGGSVKSMVVSNVSAGTVDMDGSQSAALLVHELGHSFDLSDCTTDPTCIMQPLIPSGKPNFCDDCAGDLELAGYMNLAAQLPASTPRQQGATPR